MLEYENQLLLDIVDESQLFIFARGIVVNKVRLSIGLVVVAWLGNLMGMDMEIRYLGSS